MLKNSGPVGATVFVTAILLSGAGADFSIGSAHAETSGQAKASAKADNCLAAPRGASPAGQHWYYHVDRASKRKCWYLHATEPIEHRAVVKHQAAAANPAADANAEAAPAPQIAAAPAAAAADPAVAAAAPPPPVSASVFPDPPAPTPDSAADDTPPAPHVKMLTVRTSTPFVGTAVISPQNTPEQAAAASAPQTPAYDAVAPAIDGAKPPSDSGGAEPRGKADAAYSAPMRTAGAAAADARTKTAEMFILLAIVLGLAAALIAVVGKIAGIYRKPEIAVELDDAWVDDRSEARRWIAEEAGHNEQDVPFLDPHEHYGLADLNAEEWLDRSTAQDESAVPPARNEDATQPQSPGPSQTDIEMALRVLRQARQSRVA